MATLHIAPSDTAGGSLRHAIRGSGLDDDEVLSWLDDLSCGPIASDDPLKRAEWWAPFHGDRDIEAALKAFWERVSTTDDRLVVWFGRHSASEFAFSLAWADRLGDRPYELIDVTGLQFPVKWKDRPEALSRPMQSVGIMNPDMLKILLGSERAPTAQQRDLSMQAWRRLKEEDAPFRIVTQAGLVSAPVDVFDPLLLERATPEWKSAARIVGDTMGYNGEPYMQVGPVMLLTRLVALVDDGKLLADSDPWDMRSCRVRLPA
jgi:hypothetical protein